MLEHNDIVLAGIIEISLRDVAMLRGVAFRDGENLETIGAFLLDMVANPVQSLRSARVVNAFLVVAPRSVGEVIGAVREMLEQALQIDQSFALNGVNAIATKYKIGIILNISLKDP